jgi:hypothetical protein
MDAGPILKAFDALTTVGVTLSAPQVLHHADRLRVNVLRHRQGARRRVRHGQRSTACPIGFTIVVGKVIAVSVVMVKQGPAPPDEVGTVLPYEGPHWLGDGPPTKLADARRSAPIAAPPGPIPDWWFASPHGSRRWILRLPNRTTRTPRAQMPAAKAPFTTTLAASNRVDCSSCRSSAPLGPIPSDVCLHLAFLTGLPGM